MVTNDFHYGQKSNKQAMKHFSEYHILCQMRVKRHESEKIITKLSFLGKLLL